MKKTLLFITITFLLLGCNGGDNGTSEENTINQVIQDSQVTEDTRGEF